MNKQKMWKFLTLLIGTFLMLSFMPDVRLLGFFIDAIGLDIILLFIEGYFVAILTFIYLGYLKPALLWLNIQFEKIDPFYFIPTRSQAAQCPQVVFHSAPCLVSSATLLLAGALVYA